MASKGGSIDPKVILKMLVLEQKRIDSQYERLENLENTLEGIDVSGTASTVGNLIDDVQEQLSQDMDDLSRASQAFDELIGYYNDLITVQSNKKKK